jgi:hypothetical protein
VQASDRERLTHLESYLHERVVGQDTGTAAGTAARTAQYCLPVLYACFMLSSCLNVPLR